MSGGQEAYPVYLTIGNIDKSVRRKSSFQAMVLLAYLPVDDFEHSTGDEKARLKNQLTHRAMEIVTASLHKASKEGVVTVCADGRYRRCYPVVAGVIGDWPEHCMMACVEEGACPKCEQQQKGRADYPRHARARRDRDTLEALARYFKHRDLGELKELGLKPWWPWWANLPYTDFAASIMPDVLHQLHQGMVKTHIVKWVRVLIGKRFVDRCYIAMPQAEGMRHFGKGISKLKGQWTGRESREVAKQLLPVVAGQRVNKCDPDLIGLTRTILEFSYRAHSSRMTSNEIRLLEETLAELHSYKDVIIREHVFEGNARFDRIAKLHMLSHYSDSICEMGTPDNYSTETPERLHIVCAKRGWRASNKVRPTPQMVTFMQRYEALRIHRTYMNEWCGTVGDWRTRTRRTRVIYDEEDEGTMRREPEPSLPNVVGGGGDNGDGGSDDEDGNIATVDLEAQRRDTARGAVGLARNGKIPSDADRHVVYPDPKLSIAVEPTAGRVRGDHIVATHGASDFISALHTYLKAHKTRRYVHKNFLPTLYHHFPVWHRLYLQHQPLPFDPECVKRDVVRARPCARHQEEAFDVALLRYREDVFGLDRELPKYTLTIIFRLTHNQSSMQGYRAIRVRVIFSLPPDLAWLCPHPLVYGELFTPFSTTVTSFNRLNTTSHDLFEGKRQTEIFSIYDVAAACHLAPDFRRLEPRVRLNTTHDMLAVSRYFYLNHYYNHFIFGLVEHWRSIRAIKFRD